MDAPLDDYLPPEEDIQPIKKYKNGWIDYGNNGWKNKGYNDSYKSDFRLN